MKEAIADLARDLGATRFTIDKWRRRGSVAHRWRIPLIEAAKSKDIELTQDDFTFNPKVY